MFEIKVTVEIPDLVKAAEMLAGYKVECDKKGYLEIQEALKTQIPEAVPPYNAPDMPVPTTTGSAPDMPVPTTTGSAPDANTVLGTTTAPVITNPAPVITPAPAPVTPPTVAPTAAPAFTLMQVAKAGADLITAKPQLQPQLVELLGRFGAQTVKDLPQNRLGEFAAELRALGGKI